jgi:hypothetical protein
VRGVIVAAIVTTVVLAALTYVVPGLTPHRVFEGLLWWADTDNPWVMAFDGAVVFAIVMTLHSVGAIAHFFSKAGRLGRQIRATKVPTDRRRLFAELLLLNSQSALTEIAKEGLSDSDDVIRSGAAQKLRDAGDDALVPLCGALNSGGRSMVCHLLGELGSPVALTFLSHVATRRGEEPSVRQQATRAIQRIKLVTGR